MRLDELAQNLGATVAAKQPTDGAVDITRVATLDEADANGVSFITNPRYLDQLPKTKAGAVLADARTVELHGWSIPCAVLVHPNPYVAVAQAVALLHPRRTYTPGVHPLAFVHPDAQLGKDVCVLPLAYVGRARVGDRTVVHPHAVLDDDVEVGEDGVIFPHCVLMSGTRVGARVVLQPGSVLGSDGFGFAPDEKGRLNKIPQVGTVCLGDDVEVGSCTTVDRAALGVTQLGNGVKLDNQVQIAHNVRLGNHVVIAGQSAVAGSSKLEDHVMVGGCSGVVGHLVMHKGSRLAAASYTMHDIPAGETWSGIPAGPRIAWARQMVHQRDLDAHVKTLKKLEKRVQELEVQLARPPG